MQLAFKGITVIRNTQNRQSYYLFGIIICLFLFLLLTSIVVWYGPYLSLNMYALNYIDKIQTSGLTAVATLLSLLGNKYIVTPALILTSLSLFFQGQRRLAVHLFIVIALAATIAFLLKKFIPIPRPEEHSAIDSFAFPSRHVTLCSAYLIFILAIVSPKIKSRLWLTVIVFGLILAESIARMILKVHWLTDVVGGFFLGSACGLIGAYSYHLKPDPSFDLPVFFKTFSIIFCITALLYYLIPGFL